ncbi:hypothetical protein [Haloferula sargassicola]|uniref:Tim44-like domain-containing protein n=1 Tax=Haloferula sargassicola TaxID=490096 RepID=A0ABP9UMG5_9BACT
MKRLPVLIGLLLLIGLGAWWFSPTQKMKRRVSNMIQTANVPANMPDIARNTRGPNLEKYLARKIRIQPPSGFPERIPHQLKRENAALFYSAAARGVRMISLQAPSFDAVEIEGDQATVRFQVDAIVDLGATRPVDGIMHINSRWRRDSEEGWRLESLAWEESGR